MMRLRILPYGLLALLALTACTTNGLYSLTLITSGEHQLDQNIQGDLLILGGEVVVEEGALITDSVHLLLGDLTLDGMVLGDVNFLNGDLFLGNTAVVGGDLNLGGGSYHASPASTIRGRINTGTGISLPNLPQQGRSMDLWFWFRAVLSGFISGLVAAALVRYFPGPVGRIREAVTHHSLACAAAGILAGIVGISLFVTMAYTILLIPVSLLGLFVLGVGVFLGWVGLGSELGRLLSRLINRPIKPSQTAFIGILVLTLGLEMIAFIPGIGGLLSLALVATGLGATMLTRFGLRRFVPAIEENLPK